MARRHGVAQPSAHVGLCTAPISGASRCAPVRATGACLSSESLKPLNRMNGRHGVVRKNTAKRTHRHQCLSQEFVSDSWLDIRGSRRRSSCRHMTRCRCSAGDPRTDVLLQDLNAHMDAPPYLLVREICEPLSRCLRRNLQVSRGPAERGRSRGQGGQTHPWKASTPPSREGRPRVPKDLEA